MQRADRFVHVHPSIHPFIIIIVRHRKREKKKQNKLGNMSDGLDYSARGGAVYHTPVASCKVTHSGQSYGFHLVENNTYWMRCDCRTNCIDRCLTIDLRDIFYGTTKYTEDEIDADDGKLMCGYFVPIHRGCKSATKLIYPSGHRACNAAAIFTIYDGNIDDSNDCISVFRQGVDLYMRFTISVRMALCGFKLLINAIDGRLIKLLISDIISPDYVKIIPNEGLPMRENPATKGDLYVCFKIEYPKTLSRQSKADIGDALDRAQS